MNPFRQNKIRFTWLDLFLLAGLAMLVGYMAYRVSIGLNYKWNWGVIPQYFFRFDGESGGWIPNLLMEGFLTTIRISVWSSILALILGIVMGLMLRAKSLYPRLIARTYVELVRNTPPLVLIFIFYFFLGNQIMTLLRVDSMVAASPEKVKTVLAVLFAPENQFSAFLSALLTMAVYEGAYITEIVRAGLNSVEKGQWEAADSLGLSPWYKYRYVVLPQAVRNILPSLAGQFISTIKDSAIVSVISIQELTFQGMELMSATYRTFEVWITITLLYFVLTFLCSLGAGRLESRLHKANASS